MSLILAIIPLFWIWSRLTRSGALWPMQVSMNCNIYTGGNLHGEYPPKLSVYCLQFLHVSFRKRSYTIVPSIYAIHILSIDLKSCLTCSFLSADFRQHLSSGIAQFIPYLWSTVWFFQYTLGCSSLLQMIDSWPFAGLLFSSWTIGASHNHMFDVLWSVLAWSALVVNSRDFSWIQIRIEPDMLAS